MADIFLKLVNISITAGYVVVAVLFLRLLLKRAPKWIRCVLWGFVALRLVFPFSLESALSLIPSTETVSTAALENERLPIITSGISVIDHVADSVLGNRTADIGTDPISPADEHSNHPGGSVTKERPVQMVIRIGSIVWLVGAGVLLVYAIGSALKLRSQVGVSVKVSDRVYACDDVRSPFIFGIIRPRIYIPSVIDPETADLVIAHERVHIKRGDQFWKPFGFLLLSVYWFNPLMWVAYILLCKDIELACDEKVIQNLPKNSIADYSDALLKFSVPGRWVTACPVAFGEVSAKKRVKVMLNYKKPGFWILILAIVVSCVTAACLLTDPVTAISNEPEETTAESASDTDATDATTADTVLTGEKMTETDVSTGESEPPLRQVSLAEAEQNIFGADAEVTEICISEKETTYLLMKKPVYGYYGAPDLFGFYLVNLRDNICWSSTFDLDNTIREKLNGYCLLAMYQNADDGYDVVYGECSFDGRRFSNPVCVHIDVLYDASACCFDVSAELRAYVADLSDDLYISGFGMGVDGCIYPYGPSLDVWIFPFIGISASENGIVLSFGTTPAAADNVYLSAEDYVYVSADWRYDERNHTLSALIPCLTEFDVQTVENSFQGNELVERVSVEKTAQNCVAVRLDLTEQAAGYSLTRSGAANTLEIRFFRESSLTANGKNVLLDNRALNRTYVEDLQSDGYITGENLAKWGNTPSAQY